MPAFLKAKDNMLVVTLGGMSKAEFSDAIARIRSVPGRNWNPETKENEFPKDAETALRIMQMLEPVADAECQAMVQRAAEETAEALITKLPDDAKLEWEAADLLRPYQRSAVAWLCDHPRSILADEMGLGKTIEAIGAVEEATRRKIVDAGDAILIVCPNAVRGTWSVEIEKWASLPEGYLPTVIDGKNPSRRKQQLLDGREDSGWVIVNWEKLRLMPELAKVKWGAVIADEAHRAKNKDAQQSQALWRLAAPMQLALTGTPVMNHPGDLWSLLRWLRPEQFAEHVLGGGYWPFHYSYVDDYKTKHGRVTMGVKNVDQLRFVLADKLARRTKSQVLKDLPEKAPMQVIEIDLEPAERKLYEEVEEAVLLDMHQYAYKLAAEESAPDAPDDAAVEAKLDELAHLPLAKLQGLLPNGGARLAKLRQVAAAAKIPAAIELIRDEPDTPVVAFTWHVEIARELAERLSKGKPALKVGVIAGTDDTDEPKDAFQAGELDHLVCTIAKGGTGLTLTRSSNPLLVEEDWTPAMNDQAIDRTHRYGQTRKVTPRTIRVRDTVDTGKIAPANRLKRLIASQVVGDPA